MTLDPDRGADLVLHNAKVLACESGQPRAEVVALQGNRILALAEQRDLGCFRRPGVTLVDCQGGTLLPGFNDAHCHPVALAIGRLAVDCSPAAVASLAELQARIGERARRSEEGRWIRATGYDEARLTERRAPDRWDLDRVAPRHPVVLVHATGQRCVLNSAALALVGVGAGALGERGPGIGRDPRTGEPTGVISGRQDRIARAIPAPDADEIEWGMARVDREYLSQGITSLQDVSWTNGWRHWELWQRWVERGVVSPRVCMLVGTESLARFRDAGLRTGSGDERLRLGALKLALDESTGSVAPPQAAVDELALRAHEAGFQVALHVSDLPMLETALAAIGFVRERSDIAVRERSAVAVRERSDVAGRGFRLEHCAVCPPRLLRALKASGAMVVTQPAFLRRYGDGVLEEAPPHQRDWFWPVAAWLGAGVEVAFGSDSPLASSDPLLGIDAAVTRRTEAGQQLGAREGLAVQDALKAYTLAGAQASLEADSKGSLRPGKLADLVLLDRDLTELAPGEPPAARVVKTILDGRIVWEA